MALLLGSIMLFASWLAPGHYFPWINFQNEWLAALAGLVMGAAALLWANERLRWPKSSSFAFLVIGVPVAQMLAGQIAFRSDGVMVVLYLASFGLAIAVGAALARSHRREFLDGLFGALLAAGVVSTGMAAVQWLDLGPIGYVAWIPPGARPIANVAQPNHLASLLGLSLIGALWLYETHRISGRVLWLVAVWLTIGMAMTRSRMIWIAAAAFSFGWAVLRRRTETRLTPRALTAWILFFGMAVIAWGPLSEAVGTVAPLSMAERVQGGGGRWRIWSTLLDALWQSPWVGYGWSQVSRAGLVGALDHYTGESMLRNGHSLLLDLLLWNGVPVGLLIIAGIGWWWFRQIRRCDSAERGLVLAAVGIVFVHALLEFPLEYYYFLIPTALFVGALEADPSDATRHRFARTAMAALLTGFAVAAAWVFVEYVQVEEASRENRMLAAGYSRSASLPRLVLLDEPIDYMRFWRTEARAGMSAEEMTRMRKVVERNPAPSSLLRYATAEGLNGQPEEAARTLVQLCNMHRAERCDEGRTSWQRLRVAFPVLQSVAYPATPVAP
jgi:hypothetical protein